MPLTPEPSRALVEPGGLAIGATVATATAYLTAMPILTSRSPRPRQR
ncbi:MAG TPA: hypothetical protein VGG83_24440 [Trebonia sp.]